MVASLSLFDAQAIQRDIPIPLHYQLSELLHQEIASGHWKVGQQIPTEEDLCSLFTLSRTTVRRALDVLVNAGYLRRERGRGTYIAEPKLVEELVNRPVGFYEDMTNQGIPVVTRVLEARSLKPTKAIAQKLQLDERDMVIGIDRLRLIRNEPILIVSSYLPSRLCAGLLEEDLTRTGLYTVLQEKYGLKIVRAKRFVEAVAANDYEAQMLQVKPGVPLLMIESTVYLDDGCPIEYFKARHRGDRTRLVVETFQYHDKESEKDSAS